MKNSLIILNFLLYFFISLILSDYANSQAFRKVLFEEGTSCNCGPCAASNPIFDGWLNANPTTTVAIKYHPNFGPDPMYQANPTQINERIAYMGMYAWPTVDADGLIHDCCWPFSVSCFNSVLAQRLAVSTPLTINVSDTRIQGDSIRSTIELILSSNLPAGNYKLRVMAVEELIHYSSPPGSNGEMDFRNVFRWAYPTMTGVDAPVTAGTYTFTYTYKRLSNWVDTSIYTVALVQNDVNKEVINSARGYYTPLSINLTGNTIPAEYKLYQNFPNPFNPVTQILFDIPETGLVSLKIYDVLGNEVVSILNGETKAGRYKYDFDASGLNSGVYFCKLSSKNFIQSLKMLLIK